MTNATAAGPRDPQANGGGLTLSQRAPMTVAGAWLIAVQAIMAALWGVIADAFPTFPLTSPTQALVTAAVSAVATASALWWASRHTTPTAAPVLPEGTKVGITNGTGEVKSIHALPPAEDGANG